MTCSECGAPTIQLSVPAAYRTDAPSAAAVVSFCTRCLSLEPAPQADRDGTGTDDGEPAPADFQRVSDAFPTRPERAVPLALALGLCSSLATNRTDIELLLREVEGAGGDPLLVLERLSDDPSVEPAFDLERRRHQLEQLLY
ncbi:DUF6276 family protein [Natrinema gari]|uniref:Small CPxCG-related zinc finger protein n=1 Tax=Natrinema gari JCM 14663 TaxID=1230459 RepID=L9Z2U8_9EURY|nr:DUF6276 family protein [Natrinema gari]ELY79992.1 hypothetical protein C486_09770 [Natrinema gari JCM 14663]